MQKHCAQKTCVTKMAKVEANRRILKKVMAFKTLLEEGEVKYHILWSFDPKHNNEKIIEKIQWRRRGIKKKKKRLQLAKKDALIITVRDFDRFYK